MKYLGSPTLKPKGFARNPSFGRQKIFYLKIGTRPTAIGSYYLKIYRLQLAISEIKLLLIAQKIYPK